MTGMLALFAVVLGFMAGPDTADLTPEQIREAYHRSYAYERSGDYDNAIRALSLVLQEYPNGYTVNLRLGWLYYMKGSHANAYTHYETAIRVAPYSLEAKLGYLLPLLAQGRYGDVESRAYQILSADYYNYYGNLRLAVALRLQNKLDQAQVILSKMLVVYPTDTLFLTELGQVLVGKGELEAAQRVFGDVVVLDPENPTAQAFFAENE